MDQSCCPCWRWCQYYCDLIPQWTNPWHQTPQLQSLLAAFVPLLILRPSFWSSILINFLFLNKKSIRTRQHKNYKLTCHLNNQQHQPTAKKPREYFPMSVRNKFFVILNPFLLSFPQFWFVWLSLKSLHIFLQYRKFLLESLDLLLIWLNFKLFAYNRVITILTFLFRIQIHFAADRTTSMLSERRFFLPRLQCLCFRCIQCRGVHSLVRFRLRDYQPAFSCVHNLKIWDKVISYLLWSPVYP